MVEVGDSVDLSFRTEYPLLPERVNNCIQDPPVIRGTVH
jgi:hypothetical protein